MTQTKSNLYDSSYIIPRATISKDHPLFKFHTPIV